MNDARPGAPAHPSDGNLVQVAAAAVGAADVFVFRRVTADRFVHVGGLGRGEGWAGNVDLILAEEMHARQAISTGEQVVVRADEPVRIFGPYYQRQAAFVPLSADLIVVFGAGDASALSTEDHEPLQEAAGTVAAEIAQVSSAKRLADELELLHAVHSLAQTNAVRIGDVMRHVVESALAALSCDLGILYIRQLDAAEAAEHARSGMLDATPFLPAMRALLAGATPLPTCIQDSGAEPPPPPLGACGITSHYVLPVGRPPLGVLALMHTEARPRGFTSLCREVGLRLAEAAEPLLRSALALHELETQLDRVGRDARIDPLTKLPNRRAWEEAVRELSATRPAGVLILDADRLKAVNDERGHHVGDEYLQIVAETVASSLRDGELLARLGGDEFAILLPGADELRCHASAKRIRERLTAHPGLAGFPLAASVGYATSPPVSSITEAIRVADARMYQTKQQDEQARRAVPAA
jgi:diguanylate cyclase (GGDEF)-like protein